MATNPPKQQVPKPKRSVIKWLLDSDPSIRWQAMRDLTDAPDEAVAAERPSPRWRPGSARRRPPPRVHRSGLASPASGSKGQNQAATL